MKIDAFAHIVAPQFRPRLFEILERTDRRALGDFYLKQLAFDPGLTDLETRFREMDTVKHSVADDYRQVLTHPGPDLEEIAEPQLGAELARIANDDLAGLVVAHPDRFVGFAAQLPMNDIDLAFSEAERALKLPGALGIQAAATNFDLPLDHPDWEPLIAMLAKRGQAIWLHTTFDPAQPHVHGANKYGLFFYLSGPTLAIALARLVLSGTMERYPELKIISHSGGMIPFYAKSFELPPAVLGVTDWAISEPPSAYFHRFYADTTLGAASNNEEGLRTIVEYFGAENTLFGTDYGFKHDPRQVIAEIQALGLPDSDQRLVFEGTARRILPLVNL